MEMDKESILFLILQYRNQDLLWNPKHKWHFHKIKKNKAWQDIADSANISIKDAKKKIASLLGSFRRERAKGLKTIGTGKGSIEIYKSDWFAFKTFSFLLDKDEPRRTINSTETIVNNTEIETQSEVDMEPSITNESDESLDLSCRVTTNRSKATFVKPSKTTNNKQKYMRKKLNTQEDPRIEMAFKMLQQHVKQEDATTKYAKYLDEKLNQFDSLTKSILIHKFNNLIFEAEMKLYSVTQPLAQTQQLSSKTSGSLSPTASIISLCSDISNDSYQEYQVILNPPLPSSSTSTEVPENTLN